MSVDSSDASNIADKGYIALGFHNISNTVPGTEGPGNYVTRSQGADATNPLVIPSGNYQMVLHKMEEIPVWLIGDGGQIVPVYEYKQWHFQWNPEIGEIGHETNPWHESVDITVIFSTGSPLDKTVRCAAETSDMNKVLLGTVELKPGETCQVMLVGNVHHLFVAGADLWFRKYEGGNPKYYIKVNDC